jgi:uncharacterized protein Yka (UPF0111/DUF47 family)
MDVKQPSGPAQSDADHTGSVSSQSAESPAGGPGPAPRRPVQSGSVWVRMRQFFRSLGKGAGEDLVAILVEHLRVLGEAASVVESMLSGKVSHEEVGTKITELEHQGDELRASLVAKLSKALVTPIDREDIYRLSRSIDDALDGSRDFVREWDVFRAQDPSALLRVLTVLQQAVGDMERAVKCIIDSPDASSPHVLAAQRSASRVRVVHEDEIAKLFEGGLSMRVIRQRELLHRLDAVGLHLVRAGQILADSFVKRGQ